ncbi:unnamed protein product [Fraxinus pennsylvanica]|uniref:Protein FAR1-RELATED SEQUENCE n=1 Tax=Fraxinus pennsylvanica TaxID=56036 RepID=A0AAD2E3V8_9LAMI|nr:unnamed protein product [Fraxinus pennsylvanica]
MKEHASPITPPIADPSTILTTQENLMPQFHSSVNPSIGLHFASSSNVEETLSATPDSSEVESLSTPTVPTTVESTDDDHEFLQQKNGVISTYHVEDEIHVDDFIKEVSHSVYFNEAECDVKCSCGLFETRGILCRHVFATLKVNRVRTLPDKYILDRWRKDIKRKYTLISSSYDVTDVRPDVSRYSRIMKICGDVASNAASCDVHAQDMIDKLHAMNKGYLTNKSSIQTCSNVGIPTVDTTTGTSSTQVKSPHVVRGKGRPPSLRRAPLMEKVCKPKTKNATQKGKGKQVINP